MKYGYKKQVNLSFVKAIDKVKDELAKSGFGILTEIDVKTTLKKKLDIDYDNYIILGACNPSFAYKALQAEKDIGLLLPCNVIVYEDADKVYVSAILPTIAMGMVKNSSLESIAKSVEEKLKRAVDNTANEKIYICSECGYEYKEKEWAIKCQKWCAEHKSCNLEIIKHGTPPQN